MAAIALPRAAPKPMMSRGVQGGFWGVVAVTIWGVYLAFARANVSDGVLPADLAFVRYATAGLIMLPWLVQHSPPWPTWGGAGQAY